jgi:hypothetical protein
MVLIRYSVILFILIAVSGIPQGYAQQLTPIGTATFRYFGFKVYDAKVFAPAGTKNISDVLGKVPVKLELKYARELTARDFIESGEAYMKDNGQIPFESIKQFSDQMNKLYQDVEEGDVYQIYFEPGQGVQLFLNDIPKGQVKNDTFATAYLNIWKEDVFEQLKPVV